MNTLNTLAKQGLELPWQLLDPVSCLMCKQVKCSLTNTQFIIKWTTDPLKEWITYIYLLTADQDT